MTVREIVAWWWKMPVFISNLIYIKAVSPTTLLKQIKIMISTQNGSMDLPLYICSGNPQPLMDTPDYNVCVRDAALLLIGNKKQRSQFAPSPKDDMSCDHESSGNGKMAGRLLGPTRRC